MTFFLLLFVLSFEPRTDQQKFFFVETNDLCYCWLARSQLSCFNAVKHHQYLLNRLIQSKFEEKNDRGKDTFNIRKTRTFSVNKFFSFIHSLNFYEFLPMGIPGNTLLNICVVCD